MLSTAILIARPDMVRCIGRNMLSRKTHANHPVTKWVRASRCNWIWALTHAEALAFEFAYRFNRHHQSAIRTTYLRSIWWDMFTALPKIDRTLFQNSARHVGLGLDFTHLPVIQAYKEYLNTKWYNDDPEPRWTHRGWPDWRT